MKHQFENSTSISSVEYEPETKVLTVEFKSGKSYSYADVPQETYDAFVNSQSAGRFFQTYVKSVFKLTE